MKSNKNKNRKEMTARLRSSVKTRWPKLRKPQEIYLSQREFVYVMGISGSGVHQLQNIGATSSHKIGHELYYKYRDVQELINKQHCPVTKLRWRALFSWRLAKLMNTLKMVRKRI